MRDISFGQYYPVDSPVHRLDPRTKILAVIFYMVSVFFIKGFTLYLLAFAGLAIVTLIARIPFKMVLKSLKPMLYLIAFTMILNILFASGGDDYEFDVYFYKQTFEDLLWQWWRIKIYCSGIDFALRMALRLMLLIMGPSLLTFTTTPVALTDGIESLLKPLKIVRFPVHETAIIMSITLRLIPTIMEETDKIILAQKARCADFDSRNLIKKARSLLPVLIPLFVNSLRRADDLANAMDSRCYNGGNRTRMKVLKLKAADYLSVIGLVIMLFAVLVANYNYFAWDFVNLIV